MTQAEIFKKDMKHSNRITWLHHQSYPGSEHGMVFVCHLKCNEVGDRKNSGLAYKGEHEINDKYRRHWCGYVGVPSGHPYYRVGYMDSLYGGADNMWDIEGHTHGGITYTDHFQEWGDKFWFIGFDCSHCQDLNSWSEVQDETCHKKGDMVRKFRTKEYAKKVVNGMLKELVLNFNNNLSGG